MASKVSSRRYFSDLFAELATAFVSSLSDWFWLLDRAVVLLRLHELRCMISLGGLSTV